MKNKMKKLVVSTAVTLFAFSNVMNVSAKSLKECFDAEYYASTYKDLQSAFGNNEDALYKHYLDYGIREGRQASKVFDVKVYRERYADLNAAFGDNWEAYYNHYLTYGLREGRSAIASGEVFDAIEYAYLNPDLQEAFGDDVSALFEHYVTFGIAEGRLTTEPVEDSIDNNTDTDNTTTNKNDTATEDANNGTESNKPNTDSEESDGSNVSNVEEWINNLYDSLLEDDYETVMALLENDTNVQEKCADFEYAEWPGAEPQTATAYRLTADDGTIFGIVLYTGENYWDVSAFISNDENSDYGFSDIGKGDHFVEMTYNNGATSYNYIQDGKTVIFSDGRTFSLEDTVINGMSYETVYIVWYF